MRNYLSWVPPFLGSGGNFGATSFVFSLYRLIETGRLNKACEYLCLQGDGGPDNVAWVAHGVNLMIVREGCFQMLDVVHLRVGHSHNKQDLTFAKVKAIFYPKPGCGPGCNSPMQFHAMLVDGLKTMPGGMEMLWQLANFDFGAYVGKWMNRSFAHFRKYRWWRYE